MDAKALAKSKRAHSLHHSKKHHPNPTSRAAAGSVTVTSGKKTTSKQDKDKPNRSQIPKELPSNWDRYTDEFDLGSEESPQVSTGQASDIVAPKSKGADYAYLISEAKSQLRANSSSDCFSLSDDVLNGVHQGQGPLLSVEGQRLLSWISDDNFPFGDKGTSSQEASFLSLNLHSLAEQLSKASLVERLFIEPDVLPPELFSELQATNEKNPDGADAAFSTEAIETALDGQASNSDLKEHRSTSLSPEQTSSITSTSSSISAPTSVNQPEDDFWCSGSTSEKLPPDVHADSVAKTVSRFESAAAEAELDILLNSSDETKFFEYTSVTEKSSYKSSTTQDSSIHSVSLQHQRKGPPDSTNLQSINIGLDDSLDDLLKETPNPPSLTSSKGALLVQHQWKGPSDSTNFKSINTSLDDSLDDLLKETSNPTTLTSSKGVLPAHEVKVVPNDTPSTSQPNSKSKILDEFDSWLDTI